VADDYIAGLERFLAQHDIHDYRIERRRKHRAVVVTRGGNTNTEPGTPRHICVVRSGSPGPDLVNEDRAGRQLATSRSTL
jgi:hypothetical protein